MGFYKFIKIKGLEGERTGYFVPELYHLRFNWRELKFVGFEFVKERFSGWSIWWVNNEEDYVQAINTLEELKKFRLFDYKIIGKISQNKG